MCAPTFYTFQAMRTNRDFAGGDDAPAKADQEPLQPDSSGWRFASELGLRRKLFRFESKVGSDAFAADVRQLVRAAGHRAEIRRPDPTTVLVELAAGPEEVETELLRLSLSIDRLLGEP